LPFAAVAAVAIARSDRSLYDPAMAEAERTGNVGKEVQALKSDSRNRLSLAIPSQAKRSDRLDLPLIF
jgi:hypothetical protein